MGHIVTHSHSTGYDTTDRKEGQEGKMWHWAGQVIKHTGSLGEFLGFENIKFICISLKIAQKKKRKEKKKGTSFLPRLQVNLVKILWDLSANLMKSQPDIERSLSKSHESSQNFVTSLQNSRDLDPNLFRSPSKPCEISVHISGDLIQILRCLKSGQWNQGTKPIGTLA